MQIQPARRRCRPSQPDNTLKCSLDGQPTRHGHNIGLKEHLDAVLWEGGKRFKGNKAGQERN